MAAPNADNFWRVFAAIWLGVGLPFLAIGLWVGWDELPWLRLPDQAVLTRGEVLAKDRAAGGRFTVRYRFPAAAATLLTSTAILDEEDWKRLTINGPIRVMFLSDSPQVNLVEGQQRDSRVFLAAIFSGLGGLLSTLGAIILVRWHALQREEIAPRLPRALAAATPRKARKAQSSAPLTKAQKRERRQQQAVAAKPEAGWKSTLKIVINVAIFLAALVVAAVAVELSPELRRAEAWMERHELALLGTTGAMCVLGIGLLVGSMLLRMMTDGAAQRRGIARSSSLEFNVRTLKRSAQERSDFPWAAAAGAAFITFGVFGVIISLAPMEVKLVLVAILGYVVVRTCWAIARA